MLTVFFCFHSLFFICEPAFGILFHERLGVGNVVLGIVRLAGTRRLDVLGRYATPYLASADLGIL